MPCRSAIRRAAMRYSSVSGMIRRLSDQELLEHVPYRGVLLTAAGRRVALRMLRRHRLLEAYLVGYLGYSWDTVHDEAERLEHAVSDLLIERMAVALGNPRVDPHGDPIPDPDGAIDELVYTPLAEISVGETVEIRRVDTSQPDRLRYLENSGLTPGTQVVVTRRLSRSGQSDYLLNGSPVRLRDIQDLLRGTGLGSDAGVVIEAKMIDLLLSDRAEERRSLFEEAAGIGLYRDRKHSTERRLEETATDLQRLEDLIAEVQSQIRSLARQKGKAERHVKLMEERFAVTLTLARCHLDDLADRAGGVQDRHRLLSERLPALRLAPPVGAGRS